MDPAHERVFAALVFLGSGQESSHRRLLTEFGLSDCLGG
jgi:hypothetical protein